jgi:hypothetical protein
MAICTRFDRGENRRLWDDVCWCLIGIDRQHSSIYHYGYGWLQTRLLREIGFVSQASCCFIALIASDRDDAF